MDPMTDEIKQAIAKNLPAQVGDTLRQRLTDADRATAEVKRLENEGRNKDAMLLSLQARLDKHADIDKREKDLATRTANLAEVEAALLRREVALDRIVAEQRVAGAEACVSAVHRALALMNPGTNKDDKTWNFDGSFSIPWPNTGNYPMQQTVGVSLIKRA